MMVDGTALSTCVFWVLASLHVLTFSKCCNSLDTMRFPTQVMPSFEQKRLIKTFIPFAHPSHVTLDALEDSNSCISNSRLCTEATNKRPRSNSASVGPRYLCRTSQGPISRSHEYHLPSFPMETRGSQEVEGLSKFHILLVRIYLFSNCLH
jgi:hypothetical protein